MKTLLSALFTFLVGFSTPVLADPAEVVTDVVCFCGTCGIVLGGPSLVTFDARAVLTDSGNVIFQCHFDIDEGLEPPEAIVMESPACGTPFGLANKTHIVMTPGGKAKLTCQVNPSGD